jgi:hypothetical protein
MSMKDSTRNRKSSSIAKKGRLFCFSLLTCVLLPACEEHPEGQDPAPQNDTLYALPASVNAEVGEHFQLGAQRVKGGLATNVSDKVMWTSSDAKVVIVNSTGLATATGIGSATISTTYEGFTASVNVKVSGRIVLAEVEAAPITLAKDTLYKLGTIGIVEDFTKRALPAADQAWGSSDEAIVVAAVDGTVGAVAAGTATVTLTYNGVTYSREVKVVDAPLDMPATITPDNGTTVPTGQKTTFRSTGSFGSAAPTQNITNLLRASVPDTDADFATTAASALTAVALREGEKESAVTATVTGIKGSAAEKVAQDFTITIVDANLLSTLAFAPELPSSVPANGEPFTPSFKGTYKSALEPDAPPALTFNTAGAALSFKGPVAETTYVEIISGAIYPRIAGTVTIVGTMTVTPPGEKDAKPITASADIQIVDTPLDRVRLESAETTPTTTVSVDKTIRFKATAEYGSVTQNVTTAVVWISSDPSIAMASNAPGSFGGPGKVTGVTPGTVDIKAYYRSKLVGTVSVTVAP